MQAVNLPIILTEKQRQDIKTFCHVLFSYCSGYVACRSFAEKSAINELQNTTFSNFNYNHWLTCDDDLAKNLQRFVEINANNERGCYVITGTVEQTSQAKSQDVIEMQTLLLDLDDGEPQKTLELLEKYFNPPTMVVESGGTTPEGYAKLHLYWQLDKEVTEGALNELLKLRYDLATLVGGDLHFKSAHQPIRIAGSYYFKNDANKIVNIYSYQRVEYSLEELVVAYQELRQTNIFITQANNIAAPKIERQNVNQERVETLLTQKTYAGGSGDNSRFGVLSRVVGYWLRRLNDELVTEQQALEEIYSYNLTNIVPAWPEEKLTSMIKGIWQKENTTRNNNYQKLLAPRQTELAKKSSLLSFDSYALQELLSDESTIPEDIIAPRILTKGGLLVFGGAPKVGKSDFLLNLFTKLAAGKTFLSFKPSKPLNIFYLQAEIGYDYLRERLQKIKLSDEVIETAGNRLYISSNVRLTFSEEAIEVIAEHINNIFTKHQVQLDIIAIDPLRNFFDGGRSGATENDNDAMLFFLVQRIEKLRSLINSEAGIILVHHTKKMSGKQFEEDPFQYFCGASSLRSYYSSGILLYKAERNYELLFELRNGPNPQTLALSKQANGWQINEY